MANQDYPKYTLQHDPEQDQDYITLVFSDGDVQSITSQQPNYQAVVQALLVDHADEETVREIANPAALAGRNLVALSERVRYADGAILFDGDVIDSAIARVIVRIMQEGGTADAYGHLVKFMEKLHQNPNPESIESLYSFLIRHDIAIMPDGDFIAYKGVNKDGTSIHAGVGIVNGKEFKNAHLPNEIGAVVEIPRSLVDSDTAVGCSTGLHAGSHRYAKGFANGLLLTVKINPRDVVSVPQHSNYEKIRTSRYTVLETTVQEITTVTYGTPDNDFEADGEGGKPKKGNKKSKKGKKSKGQKKNKQAGAGSYFDLSQETQEAEIIRHQALEADRRTTVGNLTFLRATEDERNFQQYPLTAREAHDLQQWKHVHGGNWTLKEQAAMRDYETDAARDEELATNEFPENRYLQFINENDSEYTRRITRALMAFRSGRNLNTEFGGDLTAEDAALLETVSELNWGFTDVLKLTLIENEALRQFKAAGLRGAGEERAAAQAKQQSERNTLPDGWDTFSLDDKYVWWFEGYVSDSLYFNDPAVKASHSDENHEVKPSKVVTAQQPLELADWEAELLSTTSPKELSPEENRQVQAYLRKTYGVDADKGKPTADEFRRQLLNEFADDEQIVLDFYYDSPNSINIHHVRDFTPLEVEAGRYGLLVKGKNANDEWRSYHYVGMSTIVAHAPQSDGGRHAV